MERQKCHAFVLRSAKYKDHDKILTLFTRSEGKLTVCAKGAMSIKCKYSPSTQLFALSEYVLSESKSGLYVYSADLIRMFEGIVKDYERLAVASYFCELIDIMFHAGMNEDITFNLIYYALDLTEKAPLEYMPLIAFVIALKLTGISGIYPCLNVCVKCCEESDMYMFDYSQGGVICPRCAQTKDLPLLTRTETEYMYALLHMDLRNIVKSKLADKDEIILLFKYINEYIRYNVGRLPRSVEQLYAI